MRNKNIESKIEEDKDKKNQFRFKSLPDPISLREQAGKLYFDNNPNNYFTKKNTAHVDSNDKNLDTVTFVKKHSMPTVGDHLKAK